MAVEQVVVRISADTKELDKMINKLVEVGKIDAKLANEFRVAAQKRAAQLAQYEKQLEAVRIKSLKAFSPGEIEAYDKEIKRLTAQMALLGKSIDNTGKQAQNTGQTFNQMLGTVKNLAGAIGIAFSVQQIVSFGKESAELARKMVGVEAAFKRIGDTGLLDRLRTATRGLATDLDLMTAAVRAQNFQIPLEQLPKLLDFATRRAQETGQSVDYLVDSIINGIGKKSSVVLDNLGISGVRLRQEFKGVSLETANIGEVAQVVGKIIDEELSKAGDATKLLGDDAARAGVAWQNLKADIGETFLALGDFAAAMVSTDVRLANQAKQATDARAALTSLDYQVERLITHYQNLDVTNKTGEERLKILSAGVRGLTATESELRAEIEKINTASEKRGTLLSTERDRLATLNAELFFVQEGFEKLNKIGIMWGKQLEEQNDKTKESKPTLMAMKNEIQSLQDKLETLVPKTKEFTDTQAQLKVKTAELDEILGKENETLKKQTEELKALASAERDAARERKFLADEFDKTRGANRFGGFTDQSVSGTQDSANFVGSENPDRAGQIGDRSAIVESFKPQSEAFKEMEEQKRYELQRTFDLAAQLSNALADLANANLERQVQDIKVKSDADIAAIDRQLNAENLSEGRKKELIKQRDALEAASAKKIADLKRKQAVNDKAAAIFNIAINTAQAIVAQLAQTPLPAGAGFVAAITAIGAIQLAAAVAQPIPKFAKGGFTGKGKYRDETGERVAGIVHEDEFVIDKEKTRKHRSALEAIHSGRFNKVYTLKKEVLRQAAESESSKVDRILSKFYSKFDDSRIVESLYDTSKRTIRVLKEQSKIIRQSSSNGGIEIRQVFGTK